MHLKSLFFLVVAVVISGCSTNRPIPTGLSTASVSDTSAIAVFSVTTDELCTSFASALNIIQTSTDKVVDTAFVNNSFVESNFHNISGNLYVFNMQPDTYTFMHEVLNPYVSSKKPNTGIFFTVKPNEVAYLGNIHNRSNSCELNLQISDKSERDLGLLISKNPNLKKENISKRLMIQN